MEKINFSKVKEFLLESDHWKHILGGFLVSLLGIGFYGSLIVGITAASCLEYKDRQHGGTWDWIDWSCTVAGSLAAAGLTLLVL